MPVNLDQYVSVHATALAVRSRRGELIANNLANAEYIDRVGGGHYIPGPGRQVMLTASVKR